MPLVTTRELVDSARTRGVGVGAFNVITLEHAEAVVEGAETAGAPVILQVSENAVRFHADRLLPLARAAAAVAELASVDVSLHLDHVTDADLLRQAADAGFSSVMFDAGAAPYDDNVRETRAASAWAHDNGLWLEAELGHVGGKPGAPASAHAPGVRTDPAEARRFVQDCGIDALAVAVGSSHAMTSRSASLDHGLVARIASAVPVPLVLHGSSGVPDADLVAAVRAGIVKVNVGTALNVAYTAAVRETLDADSALVDPRHFLRGARSRAARVVAATVELITSPA